MLVRKPDSDLKDSAYDFLKVVFPAMVEQGFLSGELIPVESVTTSEMTRRLDMLSGIDSWAIKEPDGITGIASRVQWGWKPFNTFTIRKSRLSGVSTELEKRQRAIESNGQYLYPYWTVQAYLTQVHGQLLTIGMARTMDVVEIITKYPNKERPTKDGGAVFGYCEWDMMQFEGYDVKIFDNSAEMVSVAMVRKLH